MYLKEEVIKLEKQTRQLLDEEKNGIAPQKTGALREVLKFHEYRYYIENDPLIADGEYDKLYKQLEK